MTSAEPVDMTAIRMRKSMLYSPTVPRSFWATKGAASPEQEKSHYVTGLERRIKLSCFQVFFLFTRLFSNKRHSMHPRLTEKDKGGWPGDSHTHVNVSGSNGEKRARLGGTPRITFFLFACWHSCILGSSCLCVVIGYHYYTTYVDRHPYLS